MPLITRWQDIETAFPEGLTPAEQSLVSACRAGEECVLGDGTVPPEGPADPDREIRADVLRYLIKGGCAACPVAERGVQLSGGHVTGTLDLSFATGRGAMQLIYCRFDAPILAMQSRLDFLNLSASCFPALTAERAVIVGSVFLRGCRVAQNVRLTGATIGGQLECDGSRFESTREHSFNVQNAQISGTLMLRNVVAKATVHLSGANVGGQIGMDGTRLEATEGYALNAQGIRTGGSFFLRDVTSLATIRLTGASVGGQLQCDRADIRTDSDIAFDADKANVAHDLVLKGATVDASISLNGAQIAGQLYCENLHFEGRNSSHFYAQDARIGDALIWRRITGDVGELNFASAHAGDLVDDPESWLMADDLILDGFVYDRIGTAFTDAQRRIEWLEKGTAWRGAFFPQPFTHLAKVLRDMGHDIDARTILHRREVLIRRNMRARNRIVPNGDIGVAFTSIWADALNTVLWIWDLVQRSVIGYGQRPFRSLIWLALLIILAVIPAHFAWTEGSMAPNSAPVLISPGWQAFADAPGNPAKSWSADGAPGQDWETFNRYAWATDLVIPIIDIGQTAAWAPSTTRGWWGRQLWWARGVFIVAGWIVTALGAAAITGLIKRE